MSEYTVYKSNTKYKRYNTPDPKLLLTHGQQTDGITGPASNELILDHWIWFICFIIMLCILSNFISHY